MKRILSRVRCVRLAWLLLIAVVVCVPFFYFKVNHQYESGDRLEKLREDIKRRRMMKEAESEETVKQFQPFEGINCMQLPSDDDAEEAEFLLDARLRPIDPKHKGCIVKMNVVELHPTQLAVGNMMVEQKREKLKKKKTKGPEKLNKFLLKHLIPAIRGPNGHLYLIDHHHLSFALLQAQIHEAYVNIREDWSNLPHMDAFWERMEERGYLWTYDEKGNKIDRETLLAMLPENVTGLRNDPYRDLAAFARHAGGYTKDWTPFSEFQWANYFRGKVKMTHQVVNHPPYIKAAMAAARHSDASSLPGYTGDN